MDFIEKEMGYLDSVKTFLENATDLNTLNEIKEELSDGKYLKNVIKSKKLRKQKINITRLTSEEGYEILFGKNNRENEYITFKVADKNDMWPACQGYTGKPCYHKKYWGWVYGQGYRRSCCTCR